MKLTYSLFCIVLFCLAGQPIGAQSFRQATDSVERDLTEAIKELSDLNQQIADEKLPLAKRISELEDSIVGKREEVAKMSAQFSDEELSLRAFEKEIEAQEERMENLADQLDDYVRLFESRVHISEVSQFQSSIDSALDAARENEAADATLFENQLNLVDASIERMHKLVGGKRFTGNALSSDGTLEEGSFALLGPLALFASSNNSEAGLALQEVNALDPALQVVPEPHIAGVRAIVATGSGTLPLDITDGQAFQAVQTQETLSQHLTRGGVVMIPILLLAALAMAIAIWKTIELSRAKPVQPAQVQEILDLVHDGNTTKAGEKAQTIRGPGGQLLREAVANARAGKELLEEVLLEQILHLRPRLERMLQFISLTAAVAPLLGLLGTVTGMIHTFRLIMVFGTGDARTLSSGISEALITTEVGLIVAVGALLTHGILSRRVRSTVASLEQTAVAFVNGLSLRNENLSKS